MSVAAPRVSNHVRVPHEDNANLEFLGLQSATVAHDGRNSLQRILCCTDLLARHLAFDEEGRSYLSRISQATDELAGLFDDVLDIARLDNLTFETCRVESLCNDAWEALETQIGERDAHLAIDVVDGADSISADPSRLVRVFRNLFQNSLEASSDPVVIHVKIRRRSFHGRPIVQIHVRDNGPGMAKSMNPPIGGRFRTTKRTGTGLGLSIVQRIVEAHDGFLSIKQRNPAGTDFVLSLPVTEDTLPASVTSQLSRNAHSTGAILVVDDNRHLSAALCELLEANGRRVLVANTGTDALLLFHEHGPQIDVVLADQNLPDMTGENVIQLLRDIRPTLRAVLTSGSDFPDPDRTLTNAAPMDFLRKPWDVSELLSVLCRSAD